MIISFPGFAGFIIEAGKRSSKDGQIHIGGMGFHRIERDVRDAVKERMLKELSPGYHAEYHALLARNNDDYTEGFLMDRVPDYLVIVSGLLNNYYKRIVRVWIP